MILQYGHNTYNYHDSAKTTLKTCSTTSLTLIDVNRTYVNIFGTRSVSSLNDEHWTGMLFTRFFLFEICIVQIKVETQV